MRRVLLVIAALAVVGLCGPAKAKAATIMNETFEGSTVLSSTNFPFPGNAIVSTIAIPGGGPGDPPILNNVMTYSSTGFALTKEFTFYPVNTTITFKYGGFDPGADGYVGLVTSSGEYKLAGVTTGGFILLANGLGLTEYTVGVNLSTIAPDTEGRLKFGGDPNIQWDDIIVEDPLPSAAVPEPTGFALMWTGLASMGALVVGRRRPSRR